MGNIKQIDIKNQSYYFFSDLINIKKCDLSLVKIDKKSFENIGIHYIGYITMKDSDYVKINSVNPLNIIIGEADGYTEVKNGNKYLIFAPTDKNKKVIENSAELWNEIKFQIKVINCGKPGEYGKDFMKTKFNSDDNLPLNKILKLHNLAIVVRSVS